MRRGRVMGLYLLVFTGGTPLGGPLIGVLTSQFGARTGMAVCGLVPLLATVAIAAIQIRSIRLRSGRVAPLRAA